MQLPLVGVRKLYFLVGLTLLVGCSVVAPIGEGESLSVADRQKIEELIADYSYSFDGGDIKAFSELFTEQGSLFSSVGEVKSRRDIYHWGLARRKHLSELGVKSRHLQTNIHLDASGLRTTGRTQLLLLWTDIETGVPSIRAQGTYYDEFVKTHEGWRFLSRRIGVEAN